ncbi:UDP-N-acetylmuramoyl-L-alanine--D-glutamate ligase, partial [bacterium]|nr:UDP-N-acetylmuramoyl-L-alanine--D-glutamate ligase [bacterium]
MRVLVVGAAVSGRAVLRLLDAEGHDVVVYDIDPAAVADLDPERSAAGEWDDRLLDEIDVMVPSPGVPEHSIPIQAALRRGIPIHSEIEVAAQRLGDTRLIAVTATNGKTTITEMASAMLTASGIPAAAVGNIGDPLSDAVGAGHEALVVETSSFQLRFIDTFHPDVAVLLNVAPDHLDWHGGLDAYRNAKARIHENQGEGDLLVYDEDDPGAVRAVSGARATRHPVSGRRRPSGGSGPAEGILFMGSAAMNLTRLHRLDEPFLVDLAAAGTAAIAVGADPASVISA